jgi:hypothetical protein
MAGTLYECNDEYKRIYICNYIFLHVHVKKKFSLYEYDDLYKHIHIWNYIFLYGYVFYFFLKVHICLHSIFVLQLFIMGANEVDNSIVRTPWHVRTTGKQSVSTSFAASGDALTVYRGMYICAYTYILI